MFCVHCGNELEEGALFCTKCGQKIEAAEETVVFDEVATPEEVTPVDAKERKKYESPVKGITALILAIFGAVFAEVAFAVLGYYTGIYGSLNIAGQEEMFMTLLAFYPMTLAALVLTCVAKGIAKKVGKKYGSIKGAALAGKIITIPGLILSIMNLVCTTLMMLLMIPALF